MDLYLLYSFFNLSLFSFLDSTTAFHAIDNEVIELKRIKIGDLALDDDLIQGTYRHLTEQDFKQLGLK